MFHFKGPGLWEAGASLEPTSVSSALMSVKEMAKGITYGSQSKLDAVFLDCRLFSAGLVEVWGWKTPKWCCQKVSLPSSTVGLLRYV